MKILKIYRFKLIINVIAHSSHQFLMQLLYKSKLYYFHSKIITIIKSILVNFHLYPPLKL